MKIMKEDLEIIFMQKCGKNIKFKFNLHQLKIKFSYLHFQ